MVKRYLLLLCIFLAATCGGQADTSQWVRAFSITGYIMKLNDSTSVVQVYLPDGPVLKEKQAGLLRGIYIDNYSDTLVVGVGRCHLIKGQYYYFSINTHSNERKPLAGDLLYTLVEKPAVYQGQLLRLASHLVELQNVYDESFYDRDNIFSEWRQSDEKRVIDSIVTDTRFTGEYFMKNDTSQNKLISTGSYKGKKIFYVMTTCTPEDITRFFDYILARPRLYAGKKWKTSEIFATWLGSGAPSVMK